MDSNVIELDTVKAQKIGFTSDRFSRLSFIQCEGRRMVLVAVLPRGGRQEYLEELIAAIIRQGCIPAKRNLGTGEIEDI